MTRLFASLLLILFTLTANAPCTAADPPPGFPQFKVDEIASDLKIGYAVVIADINGDKKPDIVVVDKERVVWYENPTWKMRTILKGRTTPDNVCAAAIDIDGDGQLELVVGAAWKPFDTKNPGTLQWLKRGPSLDDEWTLYPIACDEPTVHRVRVADLDGDGKPEIILAPLMGRDATAKGNWLDGRPVRLVAYKIPAKPTDPKAWVPTVINDNLHVVHNFHPTTDDLPGKTTVLTASYEGVHRHTVVNGKWEATHLGTGNQSNPMGNRGSSEIRFGKLAKKQPVIGTVEPWHGNQFVVYTPNETGPLWTRTILDDHLRWGHAVSWADLDGDGADELIAGVRDDPNAKAGDTFEERRGVRLYRNLNGKWDRYMLEDGGVAVEDLAVADLNGDGKPDIIAVGRATGNCRIYWNLGVK